MKILVLFLLSFSLTTSTTWAQDSWVIELDPVDIIPNDQIKVYSNFFKKHRENQASVFDSKVTRKVALVMGFTNPADSTIELEGLELYFNYDWAADSSGFYVQPVISREENGYPSASYLEYPERYLVTAKLGNRLYIDLSSKNIDMSSKERIYVGLKFIENVNPEAAHTFNITFVGGKIEESTYLLYPDGRKPEEVIESGRNSAGMKYSVVYKLKN
jgi:hypothetical protein